MRVQLRGGPSYTMAYCQMDRGETVQSERGALVMMSPDVGVSFTTGGGVVKGMIRKKFGAESMFLGLYQAKVHNAWVAFAPAMPGDIIPVEVTENGPPLVAETGAFLAADGAVKIAVRPARTTAMLMREGATALHFRGSGTVLLCAYGAIEMVALGPNQSTIVDTGHLVAFDDSVQMRARPLGGAVAAAATGEGLVAEITGPGRVWVQTRSPEEFGSWLMPRRNQNRSA